MAAPRAQLQCEDPTGEPTATISIYQNSLEIKDVIGTEVFRAESVSKRALIYQIADGSKRLTIKLDRHMTEYYEVVYRDLNRPYNSYLECELTSGRLEP